MRRTSCITRTFTDVANVYTENPSTGTMDVLAISGLRCRLGTVSGSGASSANERAELVSMRRLMWTGYVMPARAQVEIEAQKWQVVPGSIIASTWSDGEMIYQACDLMGL